MKITINKSDYELNFGVRFVREMDQKFPVTNSGVAFGMAMASILPGLRIYDTNNLAEVIYGATWDNKSRPSLNEIFNWIDDPETNIEAIFDGVNEELENSNALKLTIKRAQVSN